MRRRRNARAVPVGHGGKVLSVDQHAAVVGRGETGDDVQQRALARAACAHHRDEFSRLDDQRHAPQGLDHDLALAKTLRHVLHHQRRRVTGGIHDGLLSFLHSSRSTSPPARVHRACHAATSTSSLMNRTLPSQKQAFTPPG